MLQGALWALAGLGIIGFIGTYGMLRCTSRKRRTDKSYHLLGTRDVLTGLIHYEEFQLQLERLLRTESKVLIVLVDCNDLKSVNQSHGPAEGNRILRKIADLMSASFTDAALIARYGGDEFAMVFCKMDAERLNSVNRFLESEIPKLTGIQIAHGQAGFPDDGTTHEQLMHAAETNMAAMKREQWLKRESHIARSEKLRVMGELASGMAHEIRNPLTTVKGFLQISRTNGYNIEPWYDMIMDEINRMTALTGEFLRFSKPHATDFKLFPLQTCIQRVVSLTESETARLGHELVCEMPPHPVHIWMDQDKIVQMLLNMVKNAYEAIPEQGLVRIGMFKTNGFAVIEVRDTGIGMTEDELERIFQPFYTSKEEGTGLGLPICQKIVQDHGGNIEVESEKMKGTAFRISLPLPKPSGS